MTKKKEVQTESETPVNPYAELILELKAKHGTVYQVAATNSEDEVKVIFLKKLDRKAYDVSAAILKKNELQGIEVMLKALYIGGDDINDIINDFDALRSAANQLVELVTIKPGAIKKI